MNIILASTSPYRRKLLQRLGLDFTCAPPNVTEEPRNGESPAAMAERLAYAKARAVSAQQPDSLVIGSDQVASIDDTIIGKPGNFENAKRQLQMSSTKEVRFYTAIALICTNQGIEKAHVEPYCVRFRKLTEQQIDNYLLREQPYDCAGSFKAEGLGIALFEQLSGRDPTSLEGLPLISLTELLSEIGVHVLNIS